MINEQHIYQAVDSLHYNMGHKLVISSLLPSFRETILQSSSSPFSPQSHYCMSKSPNRHNRLYMQSTPLSGDIVSDLESHFGGYATQTNEEMKKKATEILSTYLDKANEDMKKRLWCFGPETSPSNILVESLPAPITATYPDYFDIRVGICFQIFLSFLHPKVAILSLYIYIYICHLSNIYSI